MYHDDPIINDLVLTIINDGNGLQCGMTYEDRKKAAKNRTPVASMPYGLHEFRTACRTYNQQRIRDGGKGANRLQILRAADFLLNYYREHLKECGE